MSTFETTLKGVLQFYYYSPRNRRELTEISEICDQIHLHFGDIKQVRWERAIKAMLFNHEVVVSHLEHDFVTESPDSNKPKHCHHICPISEVYAFLEGLF
jgi:hypothetical protein